MTRRFRTLEGLSPCLVERTDIGLRYPLLQQQGRRQPPAVAGAHSVLQQTFDFGALADTTFLGSFAADPRRANLVLYAAPADMVRLVPRLTRIFDAPVQSAMVGHALQLPADRPATLLLHDVSRLSVVQQIELADWMSARQGHTQVVAISSVPLRTLVEEGLFLQGLFHRLCGVEASLAGCPRSSERGVRGRRAG